MPQTVYLGAFERPAGVLDDGRTEVVHVVQERDGTHLAVFSGGWYSTGRTLPRFYKLVSREHRGRCVLQRILGPGWMVE